MILGFNGNCFRRTGRTGPLEGEHGLAAVARVRRSRPSIYRYVAERKMKKEAGQVFPPPYFPSRGIRLT